MGARLMTLVLMRWTHVSDRAFRVLSRMATTALDEPVTVAAPGVRRHARAAWIPAV